MAVTETVKKLRESISKPSKGSEQNIEFTYESPNAKKVCLAGKFNDWNTKSLPMRKDKDGLWRITVKLSAGRYEYKYFVDGAWAQNIPCSNVVLNSFGTYNCVIGVE